MKPSNWVSMEKDLITGPNWLKWRLVSIRSFMILGTEEMIKEHRGTCTACSLGQLFYLLHHGRIICHKSLHSFFKLFGKFIRKLFCKLIWYWVPMAGVCSLKIYCCLYIAEIGSPWLESAPWKYSAAYIIESYMSCHLI